MLEVSSDISQSFEYLLQSKLFEYANYSELLNISKHHDTNTLGQSKAEHVNLLVFVYLSLWVRTYGIFWRILANLSCTPLLVISSGGRAAEQTIAHFNVYLAFLPCIFMTSPRLAVTRGCGRDEACLSECVTFPDQRIFLIKVPYPFYHAYPLPD